MTSSGVAVTLSSGASGVCANGDAFCTQPGRSNESAKSATTTQYPTAAQADRGGRAWQPAEAEHRDRDDQPHRGQVDERDADQPGNLAGVRDGQAVRQSFPEAGRHQHQRAADQRRR